MFIKSKKGIAFLGVVVVAIVAAVGAYAYFSAAGSGTGTATVGTTQDFTLTGSATGTLYPGTSEDVAITAQNNGAGPQELGGAIDLASVAACSSAWSGTSCNGGAAGVGDVTGCGTVDPGNVGNADHSDFYMADVPDQTEYAASGSSGDHGVVHGTLTMNDLSTSQNACKGANLLLNFGTR